MLSREPKPNLITSIAHNAVFGFVFILLPAFFLYGSHDLWNLPRWVLASAFLTIALPIASLHQRESKHLPKSLIALYLFWITWTVLSAMAWTNTGDIAYLMGIRFTGLGILLWLLMQKNVDKVIPSLVVLGTFETLIGFFEFSGLVTMNELMQVPIGTAGNNNIFGCLMVLLLPFPLLWINREDRPKHRIGLIAIALGIGSMVAVSGSRTAVLALLISTFTVLALYFLKNKTRALENHRVHSLVVVLIPLLLIAIPIFWAGTNFKTGQLPTEATTGITERGTIWRETIDMCQEAPLLGSGPASWKYNILERGLTGYSTQYGLRFFTRPHNDFLWIAAESGIPAALSYAALLILLFYLAVRQTLNSTGRKQRTHNYILAGGVLIWILISNLNFPLERVDHLIIFSAIIGLILTQNKAGLKFHKVFRVATSLLGAALFIGLTVFAGKLFLHDRHLQKITIAREAGQPQKVLLESSQISNNLFSVEYYSSTPIAWYRGIALLQTGKQKEALEQFTLSYIINPWHPHVLNNLASTYVMLGKNDKAEIYYREAIDRFRGFPDPYINLSRILRARGDRKGAISLLNTFPDEVVSHKQSMHPAFAIGGLVGILMEYNINMPKVFFKFFTTSCLLFIAFLLVPNSFLPAQSISSCVPNSSPAGTTVNVTVTGTGVNFNSATAIVDMKPLVGPSIYASTFTVTSDTTVDATFSIPSSAPLGDYSMRVGSSTPYIPAVFAVTASANTGTIKGKIFHDVNENCVKGNSEPNLAGFLVHVTPSDYYAITSASGDYQAYVPAGTYSVEVIPPTYYSRLCPASPISATVSGTGSISSGNDFAMDVDTVTDGGVSCGSGEFRPGFNTVITVQAQNVGIDPLTGEVQMILDTNLTYISSTPTGTISGDTVKWAISPAIPPGGSQNYSVEVNLPTTVPLGTTLFNSTWLVTDSADNDIENNFFECNATVIGSYDPNDKTVWDEDMNLADPGIDASDSVLIYRIRFQNTGTASAINIFIRDTLDANLDVGSIDVIGTSHLPYSMNVSGQGHIEWRFPDIHLPDSTSNEPESHGFVLFRIKTKPAFTTGMSILNTAHIYFDFNAPVVTNQTSTSIIVSRDDPTFPALLKVFPNPASDRLHIELECISNEGVQCKLIDPFGGTVRELQRPCFGGIQQFEIPVEDLSTGVYFLETTIGSNRTTHKVAITR